MKKAISVFLALALTMLLCVPAFAADGNVGTGGGKQDIVVSAWYVDSSVAGTVYSVDVAWGAMEFTYTRSGSKDWDPVHHDYKDNTTASWTATGNEITVTNHSNTQVTASFAYEAAEGYTSVTGSFDHASLTLPSAEGRAVDAPDLLAKTTLTLSGTLDSNLTSITKIGKVTVTISR